MIVNRDLLIISGGRIATALIGLLTIRAVTTLLSPEQYGQLALLIVVQTFCGLFLVNPVGQHINRHTHEWWDEGSLFSRLRAYKKYIFLVSIIGGFAAIAVSTKLSALHTTFIVLAMLLMVNGGTWNATWIPLLNMVGQRGSAISWALVTSIIGLLVSVVLCIFWPTAINWFMGQAIGFTLGALGAFWSLRHSDLPKQNEKKQPLVTRQTITTYCLPLAVGTGFMWLQLSGYRLVVEHYWGLYLLGFLSVGLSLASQIWGLAESLAQQFLYPFFYKRIAVTDSGLLGDAASSEALSDLLNVLMPVYVVLIGVTFLGAPYLLKVLVAPQYANAEIFVRLGIVIEFCRVTANILSNAAQVTKNPRSIILPYAAGALVIFIILIIGQRHLEISSVAISLVIGALLMLSIMWGLMLKQVKFHPDFKIWFTALMTMLMFIVSSYWLPRPSSWFEIILILLVDGLVGLGLLMILLKRSDALQRLLAVNLNTKNKAVT